MGSTFVVVHVIANRAGGSKASPDRGDPSENAADAEGARSVVGNHPDRFLPEQPTSNRDDGKDERDVCTGLGTKDWRHDPRPELDYSVKEQDGGNPK